MLKDKKSLGLLLAIIGGIAIPQASQYSSAVQYGIMLMLFTTFLSLNVSRRGVSLNLVWVLSANIVIALIAYAAVLPFDNDLAVTAFVTAASPTATAAPVIMRFLHGKVEYVVASMIVTNLAAALLLPLATPTLTAHLNNTSAGTAHMGTLGVLRSVLVVIFLPLALAIVVRSLTQLSKTTKSRLAVVSFPTWIVVVFLAVSSASNFIEHSKTMSLQRLLVLALLTLVICATNFALGYLIGGKEFAREASQSLGQKNNGLTIWFALAYLSPFAALGPTIYAIYHNVYNSFQLSRADRFTNVS